ncbi:hypothetical protein GUJ93_ZPchr0015g6856 [Zizania palustris]|uniref:Uncharacterized protein n=1 Tax=Zizania palustris TaxID=103762 RepID=A0A8J5TDB3_ZIZPA|nr:hypothetical protein GUJ93_ZPchr0015g6856 [Zizania palustris]
MYYLMEAHYLFSENRSPKILKSKVENPQIKSRDPWLFELLRDRDGTGNGTTTCRQTSETPPTHTAACSNLAAPPPLRLPPAAARGLPGLPLVLSPSQPAAVSEAPPAPRRQSDSGGSSLSAGSLAGWRSLPAPPRPHESRASLLPLVEGESARSRAEVEAE